MVSCPIVDNVKNAKIVVIINFMIVGLVWEGEVKRKSSNQWCNFQEHWMAEQVEPKLVNLDTTINNYREYVHSQPIPTNSKSKIIVIFNVNKYIITCT